MSDALKPTDFGLHDVPLVEIAKPKRCVRCGDSFSSVRWSKYFCPDCDIKRMKRVDDSMKQIAERWEK